MLEELTLVGVEAIDYLPIKVNEKILLHQAPFWHWKPKRGRGRHLFFTRRRDEGVGASR